MPTYTRGTLRCVLIGLAVLIGAAIGPVNAASPGKSTGVNRPHLRLDVGGSPMDTMAAEQVAGGRMNP